MFWRAAWFSRRLVRQTLRYPDPDVLIEPTITTTTTPIPPFSAGSLAHELPNITSSAFVNEDFYFEAYSAFQLESSFALPALSSSELPVAFSASALPYNSILDLGCTH